MPTLSIETRISASRKECFALIRDPRVIGNAQLIGDPGLGQTIVFTNRFAGHEFRTKLRVVEFEQDGLLTDEIISGPMREFRHRHVLEGVGGVTIMRDKISWRSKFGPVGWLTDRLFLRSYFKHLVTARNARLSAIAAGGQPHQV